MFENIELIHVVAILTITGSIWLINKLVNMSQQKELIAHLKGLNKKVEFGVFISVLDGGPHRVFICINDYENQVHFNVSNGGITTYSNYAECWKDILLPPSLRGKSYKKLWHLFNGISTSNAVTTKWPCGVCYHTIKLEA